MGYVMRILRIDFPRLNAIPGSRDSKLLARIRPDLEDLWDPDDFEEDEEPPLAMPPEALEQILNGNVPKEEWGGEPYYEAVAAIYSHIAVEVDEVPLSSHEMSHLNEVEQALLAAGSQHPLSLLSLVLRGVPFKVPAGEDFPYLVT